MPTRLLYVRLRTLLIALPAIWVASLLSLMSALKAEEAKQINVVVDQAKLIKLPEHVATIVVGNPLIADVTLQANGIMVVTGKGYGATNIIAMDRDGKILIDSAIQVEGPSDKLVTVYRGINRETYSCTPVCQRRVTLGDGSAYFSATLGQAGNFATQSTDTAAAAPNNTVTEPKN
jgi:hypothetical protein